MKCIVETEFLILGGHNSNLLNVVANSKLFIYLYRDHEPIGLIRLFITSKRSKTCLHDPALLSA